MFGIWDKDKNDWVREGAVSGRAILAFEHEEAAEERAAQRFGFETYEEAADEGWCEVKPLVGKEPINVIEFPQPEPKG